MDNLTFTEEDLKIKAPAGVIVAGPSMSGKTTWIKNLIKYAREMISPPPAHILFCYGIYDPQLHEFEEMGCELYNGVPDMEFLDSKPKPLLMIMDDQYTDVTSKYLQDLFTKVIHHKNITVFFVTQNLFDKVTKVARWNSQHIVLMDAPSDQQNIQSLGKQIFPGEMSFFRDALKKATSKPYGYVFLTLRSGTHPALKVRTNIFPGEIQTVFRPN